MFSRVRYLTRNWLSVHWRINRKLFLWLAFFIVVGVVIGIITVFTPRITAKTVSESLLDDNILRAVRPTTGFGAMVLGRLFDFTLFFSLLFICCLSRWSLPLVFALVAYRGFSFVVNMYWALARFGLATGTVLFIIYFVLLLVLLVIALCSVVFALRATGEVRKGGFRGGIRWRDFSKQCLVLAVTVGVFAVAEWLMYSLILSKFVFAY